MSILSYVDAYFLKYALSFTWNRIITQKRLSSKTFLTLTMYQYIFPYLFTKFWFSKLFVEKIFRFRLKKCSLRRSPIRFYTFNFDKIQVAHIKKFNRLVVESRKKSLKAHENTAIKGQFYDFLICY